MYRVLLAALAAIFVLAGAGSSAPTPTGWSIWTFDYQTPVEQQTPGGETQPDPSLWVVNPTLEPGVVTWVDRCLWDSDDHEQWAFSGTLAAGQTISVTRCMYADWQEKMSAIQDRNADPHLQVSVTVGSTTVAGQNVACVLGPDYDASGASLVPVDGSNGGRAVLTPVTFSVTNTGTKTLRRQDALAYVGIYLTRAGGTTLDDVCQPLLGARTGFDPAWTVGTA